jgi:cell division protein FtsB
MQEGAHLRPRPTGRDVATLLRAPTSVAPNWTDRRRHGRFAAMRERAWIIPLGLLVITSVAVPLQLVDGQGIPRYMELRAQIARVGKSNAQLEREIKALEQETELLRNDARAIERLARDDLGMVRAGEIVFQFPN